MRIKSWIFSLILMIGLVVPVQGNDHQIIGANESLPIAQTLPVEADASAPHATEPTVPTAPSTDIPEEGPEVNSPALEVDTRNLYEGMEHPYENGYMPRVADDTVQIVLPLRSVRRIRGDRLKAALNLGTGSELPFVAANYEKEFSKEQVVPLNAEEPQEIYLVSFSVKLTDGRINGTYPIEIRISAQDDHGRPVAMNYTVFVTITDGQSGEPEIPAAPEPEKPTAEPVVYISSAKLEPQTAMAGEPFTLTLTLHNSQSEKAVEDLLVTVEPANLQINLLEDSTVISVGEIAPGEDAVLVLHFSTDPAIAAEKQKINFRFQYNSGESLGLHSEGSYILDVRQSARLDYDGAVLPVKVFQQDMVTLSVNLMNTGKSTLYNCRISYEIDGLTSGGTTFVGEIPAGENKVGNGALRVSSEQLGEVHGTALITYEDAFGQVYTQTAELTTNIAEKQITETETQQSEKKDRHWWLFVLLGLAAGAGLGFGIPWYLHDRRQRKEDDLRL